jgi:circadian clock protein KaiC
MSKVKSGINGFDELFEDGIPAGSDVLIFGKAGSGKTIMALEFIFKGASLYNESGLFVSFEQSEKALIEQCSEFGWDIKKYLKSGKIRILAPETGDMDKEFANKIISEAKRIKAKRVVIDNLALLALNPLFNTDTRKFSLAYDGKIKIASTAEQFIYNLITILKNLESTTIYITSPGDDSKVTSDGISEYICDGVIHLDIRSLGKSSLRTIEASKMRRSNLLGGIRGFKITSTGIKVE